MMTPDDFRAWRKALGWKQKEAAERLGLRKRMIQYYEKGNRDGKDVKIPKTVRLACFALANGIDDFDGTAPVRLSEPAKIDKTPAGKAKPGKDGAGSKKDAAAAKKGAVTANRDGDGAKKPAKRKAAAGGEPAAGADGAGSARRKGAPGCGKAGRGGKAAQAAADPARRADA